MLLANRGPLDARTLAGNTPLHEAAAAPPSTQRLGVLQALVAAPAVDLQALNGEGLTALDIAGARGGDGERVLQEAGAGVGRSQLNQWDPAPTPAVPAGLATWLWGTLSPRRK